MEQLDDGLDVERRAREALAANKGKEVETAEARLNTALELEKTSMIEGEEQLYRFLEEKIAEIRRELDIEVNACAGGLQQNAISLQENASQLQVVHFTSVFQFFSIFYFLEKVR